jgi:hypothetical protein
MPASHQKDAPVPVSCEPASGRADLVFGVEQGADGPLKLPDHQWEIVDSCRYQGFDVDVPVAVDDPVA